MKPGRELDTQVAERVMHWKTFAGEPGYGRKPEKLISLILDPIPHYSTDIAAAWTIVDKFSGSFWMAGPHALYGCDDWNDTDQWLVSIRGPHVLAETAPLAICRAALQAVS